MAKRKERARELEFLRAENRHLRKKIKILQKQKNINEEIIDEDNGFYQSGIDIIECKFCKSKDIKVLDLTHLILKICGSCNEREKIPTGK